MRRRARLIAIVVVACTATVASGDFKITPPTTSAGSGAPAETMRTVVSIRNLEATPVTATILTSGGGAFQPAPCLMNEVVLQDLDGMTSSSWPIDGGEQKQLMIVKRYCMAGAYTTNWTATAPSYMAAPFTSTAIVGAGNDVFNVQPQQFDFVVSGAKTNESQRAVLQNYGTTPFTYMTVATSDPALRIRKPGSSCDGQMTCAGEMINPGVYTTVEFVCTPPPTGQVSGTITYIWPFGPQRSQTFTCSRGGEPPYIRTAQPSYTLSGPVGADQSTSVVVDATMADNFGMAEILGADATAFRLVAPAPCNGGTSCMFLQPNAIGPGTTKTVTVACAPGMTQKTATLRVRGTAHAYDFDDAELTCVADGGLQATPTEIDVGDVKVTTMASNTITIENLGSATASVSIDTGHPDWTVNTCGASPCSIGGGQQQPVVVTFKPTVPEQNDRVMTIALNGMPAASVMLRGNGVGSRMRVTSHASPYQIDFGTIGLNTTRERTVTLKADGNRSLNVAIGMPSAPFTTTSTAVDLAAGADGTFDITCRSSTPGTFTSMVTLMPGPAEHVYASDTPKLDVQCRVANTPVQLSPDELDFGEVRRGAPPPSIVVDIHNPSAAAIPLDYVRLSNASGPVTLTMPTDTTLDPGETIAATITLATAVEVTVMNALEVGVGGEQLVSPISGKVVTASARVTPTSLRLGSVCVGTMIDEPVKMVNNGTARLRVRPPMMENPFAITFVNPVSYPPAGALLAPLEEALASVRISTQMPGKVMGKLTWDVDVPGAPFVIDATLDIKDAGTAVSPQAISFDEIRVAERSERRTIRLENCGDAPSEIVLDGVTAMRGTADAWELTPSRVTTRLEPTDKIAIEVRFAPKQAGVHAATVRLAVDGVTEEIELTGEAIGDDVKRESLYACSCAAGGSPWQGLLVLAVWLVIIFRRRTGSSSAR